MQQTIMRDRNNTEPGTSALLAGLFVLLAPLISHAQSFCSNVTEEPLTNPTILGNGTAGSISTAQIQAALDAGGDILLDQGAAPTTIIIDQTLVASGETVLDGGGLITLSGNDSEQIMRIINPDPAMNAPLFTVTLQNINFTQGRTTGGRGGAIYKEHDFEFPHKVSLKLVNCEFSDNHAPLDGTTQDDGGGAFYAELMDRIEIAKLQVHQQQWKQWWSAVFPGYAGYRHHTTVSLPTMLPSAQVAIREMAAMQAPLALMAETAGLTSAAHISTATPAMPSVPGSSA